MDFRTEEISRSRGFGIEPREERSSDENVRLLTFTAASDDPYTRPMWVGNVREVTDFRGLDETRLRGKQMPLLDTHRNEKLEDILGRIVGHRQISRGDGTALEVTAEFRMDDPHSRAAYEKVKAGLVNNVSIGYTPKYPDGMETEWHTDKKNFDYDNDIAADVRLVDWEILEISLVPVPADNSIGIGRSGDREVSKAYKDALAASKINPKSTTTPRSNDMTDTAKPEAEVKADEVAAEKTAAEARSEEAIGALEKRLQDIEKDQVEAPAKEFAKIDRTGQDYIAKNAFNLVKAGAEQDFVTELAEKAGAEEGMSEAQVKAQLWEHIQNKDTKSMNDIGQGRAPALRASKDAPHNFFNFERAIRQLIKGADTIDGREAEVLQDFKSSMRKDKAPSTLNASHSILIPHAAFAEDARVRSTINSWGGPRTKRYDVGVSIGADNPTLTGVHHEVFDEFWLTERLINKATVLPYINFLPTELAQDLIGVTESGSITTGFLASENATRSESPGLTFGNRALRWKMAFGRKDFSQRALDQSHYLFGHVLMRLREDLMRRLDEEALVGDSNTDGGFLGIFNYPSVNTIAAGRNTNANDGGAVDYRNITDMIEAIENANVDVERTRWIVTPGVKAQLRRTARLPSQGNTGTDDAILTTQYGEAPSIEGIPVITTNVTDVKKFPKGTLTKASSTLNGMALADLSMITGGYFSGMELAIDPYSAMETGQTRVYLRQALDVQVDHVEGFSVIKDVKLTAA